MLKENEDHVFNITRKERRRINSKYPRGTMSTGKAAPLYGLGLWPGTRLDHWRGPSARFAAMQHHCYTLI